MPSQSEQEEALRVGGRGEGVPMDDPELSARRQALGELIDMMRPAVQADGGDLVLVDADLHSGVVTVELQGACSSCAISSSTLQGGVERILKQRLGWVTEVRGGVEEAQNLGDSIRLGRGSYVPKF